MAYLGGISLHIWTIKGYFDTIPAEIEEGGAGRRRLAVPGVPAGAPADGGADPRGGLRAGVHRRHHRVPAGVDAPVEPGAVHARGRLEAVPLRAAVPVGRLRRRRGARRPADHRRVPARAAVARLGAHRRRAWPTGTGPPPLEAQITTSSPSGRRRSRRTCRPRTPSRRPRP